LSLFEGRTECQVMSNNMWKQEGIEIAQGASS
jgi:hypothetical protein